MNAPLVSRSRIAPIAAVILTGFAIHIWYLNCVAEDAYISFRFARNLARGHGLVWNVGEPPVEGYTNFLWVLLCAGAYRLGLDLPRFSQWAGIISASGVLAYVFRFGRQLLAMSAGWALTACALVAAGPLACWAGSGMETPLF